MPMSERVAQGYSELITRYDDMWNWYGHFTFRLENTKHSSVNPEKEKSYAVRPYCKKACISYNKLYNKDVKESNVIIFWNI